MNAIEASNSVLVLVDYQQRLMPAIHPAQSRSSPRPRGWPMLRAHSAFACWAPSRTRPASGPTSRRSVSAAKARWRKTHFDACEDGLLDALGDVGEVVIAGCEAHVCLLQTTLGLLRAGRAVWVVGPACGSRSSVDHELAMQRSARRRRGHRQSRDGGVRVAARLPAHGLQAGPGTGEDALTDFAKHKETDR